MNFVNDMAWVLPLRSEELSLFFKAVTALGYFQFLFVFMAFGFYFWRSSVFYKLALMLFFTGGINMFLKDVMQDPRPDAIFSLDEQTGESYGWPSGHAQMAIVLWGWLALHVTVNWQKILLWTVAALICFSRLYLGVHDIGDISGGVVLGGLTLWLWYQLSSSDKLENAFQELGAVRIGLGLFVVQLIFVTLHPIDGLVFVAAYMWGIMMGWYVGWHLAGASGDTLNGGLPQRLVVAALCGGIGFIGLIISARSLRFAAEQGEALHFGLSQMLVPNLAGLGYGIFIAGLLPLILRFVRLAKPNEASA